MVGSFHSGSHSGASIIANSFAWERLVLVVSWWSLLGALKGGIDSPLCHRGLNRLLGRLWLLIEGVCGSRFVPVWDSCRKEIVDARTGVGVIQLFRHFCERQYFGVSYTEILQRSLCVQFEVFHTGVEEGIWKEFPMLLRESRIKLLFQG